MDDEQDKYLDEAVAVVKQASNQLLRAIDAANLDEVIKHATTMLSELKTSLLSPKNYYELYMQIFDQLSQTERFFMEEYRRGKSMKYLFDRVQFVQHVVPRLYLIMTVGSVYIQTKDLPAKDLIKDMIEMAKGVQHPMRGLFVRYYLNKLCKDKLPDIDNQYEGHGGTVQDSIDFLLTNLSEMNRLWIRIQYTGGVRDKKRREKERNDLRVTVGENIVRLSNLDGLNLSTYKETVLPKILETVTSSNDLIAQQYLFDCIIQAFPDEYHMNTLDMLLEACNSLQANVDIRGIFVNLMDRLSSFANENELKVAQEVDIYELFKTNIDKIVDNREKNFELKKLLELQVAFLRFSLKCYPTNIGYVNQILSQSLGIIQRQQLRDLESESLRALVNLLGYPLETLSLKILEMDDYTSLMDYLKYSQKKQVALKIVQGVVTNKTILDKLSTVEFLLQFIQVLLVSNQETPSLEPYELEEEMTQVSKLIHLIRSDDNDEWFSILSLLKRQFNLGGEQRIKHLFPPLIFGFFNYANQQKAQGQEPILDRLLKNLLDMSNKLSTIDPELTLKLNIEIVQFIDFHGNQDYEEMGYEFASQALIIYQDKLKDVNSRFTSIQKITGGLIQCKFFNNDNYDTLISNTAQFCARQQKKNDQARGALIATNLFWNNNYQEENRLVEFFKRTQKLTQIYANQTHCPGLYLQILNKMLYFIKKQASGIDNTQVQTILAKVRENIEKAQSSGDAQVDAVRKYLSNTLKFINTYRSAEFQGISV